MGRSFFGDVSKLSELVKLVAHWKGIGNELAEGTKRISEKYGGKDFAINAKG